MAVWDGIHILWFEAYNVFFVPNLHLERFGHPTHKQGETPKPCLVIGQVRYFSCFKIESDDPIYFGDEPYVFDASCRPDLQINDKTMLVQAPPNSFVNVFRSFDVRSAGARYTGEQFLSNGSIKHVDLDRFAFKTLRSGWQYVGVNLQLPGKIGPVVSNWVEGHPPKIHVNLTSGTPPFLEVTQHSSFPDLCLSLDIERRLDEYPLQTIDISVSSSRQSSLWFSDKNALIHSDRIRFRPPLGFGFELMLDGKLIDSTIIEYNSVNAHLEKFLSAEALWRTHGNITAKAPITVPAGVSNELWTRFFVRFPVLSEDISILAAKGLDLQNCMSHFYDFPNILIRLLLQQSKSELTECFQELRP